MKHLLNISTQECQALKQVVGTSWTVDYSFNPIRKSGFNLS